MSIARQLNLLSLEANAHALWAQHYKAKADAVIQRNSMPNVMPSHWEVENNLTSMRAAIEAYVGKLAEIRNLIQHDAREQQRLHEEQERLQAEQDRRLALEAMAVAMELGGAQAGNQEPDPNEESR